MERKNSRAIVSNVERKGVELQGLGVTGRPFFAVGEWEVMFCEVSCPASRTFSLISYHR